MKLPYNEELYWLSSYLNLKLQTKNPTTLYNRISNLALLGLIIVGVSNAGRGGNSNMKAVFDQGWRSQGTIYL